MLVATHWWNETNRLVSDVLLRGGASDLMVFLDEVDESGGPLHDLDLYRTERGDKKLTKKTDFPLAWTVYAFKSFKFLDKITLKHSSGTTLCIDQVDMVTELLPPGCDLGNVHVKAIRSAGQSPELTFGSSNLLAFILLSLSIFNVNLLTFRHLSRPRSRQWTAGRSDH